MSGWAGEWCRNGGIRCQGQHDRVLVGVGVTAGAPGLQRRVSSTAKGSRTMAIRRPGFLTHPSDTGSPFQTLDILISNPAQREYTSKRCWRQSPGKLGLACDRPGIVIECTKLDQRRCVMQLFNRNDVEPFVGDDGAIVRELASPGNSSLTRHSLAEIRHPPGTASQEHYHTEAEEVYYVIEGQGAVRVDGETRTIGPGDVVVIVPGQRHTVWQEGEGDLVLLVTCVPAYTVEEVVFSRVVAVGYPQRSLCSESGAFSGEALTGPLGPHFPLQCQGKRDRQRAPVMPVE